MSHIKLAEALRISNSLENVFGATPYEIKPYSGCPSEMICCTRASTWRPLIVFILCIIGLGLGGYLQITVNLEKGNVTTVTEVAGVDIETGSVTFIIAEITIFTTLIAYAMAIIVTLNRRQTWRNFMVSVLEKTKVLDTKYKTQFDTRKTRRIITFVLLTLATYHIVYISVFQSYYINGGETYYLVPVTFMIEMCTASMTAVDIITALSLLDELIIMFGTVPTKLIDEQYFVEFTTTLDLIEVVAQNHGYREFYSIGNEFIVMLAQIFYMFYGIAKTDGLNLTLIIFGFASVIPKFLKLRRLAEVGKKLTESVGGYLIRL